MKLFLLTVITLAGCLNSCQSQNTEQSDSIKINNSLSGSSQACRQSYSIVKQNIEHRRTALNRKYDQAGSDSAEQSILNAAKQFIISAVCDSLVQYWYGTKWEFNGQTLIPGKGSIACGYFVSTLLKHAGFKVERVKMAQSASELIIKSLTSEKHIQRFSNVSIEDFVNQIRKSGEGLYVTGLDYHTGFLLCRSDTVRFIHSSYQHPYCVINENAYKSAILAASVYRAAGKISDDKNLVRKWLAGNLISVKTEQSSR